MMRGGEDKENKNLNLKSKDDEGGGDKENKNLNLKSKDDGPDETQNHPGVSVHYILSTNILQTNLNQRNS